MSDVFHRHGRRDWALNETCAFCEIEALRAERDALQAGAVANYNLWSEQMATLRAERDALAQTEAAMRRRLAEAEALLRDIAEMRVPVLPSRFMDESMAEAARAFLAADSGSAVEGER